MGRSHPKQLIKCGRVSDVYRLCVVETALFYKVTFLKAKVYYFQLIQLQERKLKRKLGLTVIVDLEGFNTDHLTTSGLKVYSALLKELQDLFPDMLRQVFCLLIDIKILFNSVKGLCNKCSLSCKNCLHSYQTSVVRTEPRENCFSGSCVS